MGKPLQLSGIIVVLILLAFGFVVGETLTELKSEVSAIKDNDNTELQSKVTELETALSTLEENDNTELLARITALETALSAVEENDNTELLARITALETALSAVEESDNTELLVRITALETALSTLEGSDNTELLARITQLETALNALEDANTNVANNTIMLDALGNYLSFEELVQLFGNKYFAGYVTKDSVCSSDQGDIWISPFTSGLSNEDILARIYLLLQELSNYDQYLTDKSTNSIGYSYNVGDINYSIYIIIPSPVLANVDFTLDDILNSTFGITNDSMINNNITFDMTPMPFDSVLLKQLYAGYISNNTFGNNLLTPLSD